MERIEGTGRVDNEITGATKFESLTHSSQGTSIICEMLQYEEQGLKVSFQDDEEIAHDFTESCSFEQDERNDWSIPC